MKPYYKTKRGKLFCCDNVEYLKTVDDNTFDLTVTSPPYDNLRNYKGHSWDYKKLAKELYRTTKDGGVVVWIIGDATINGSETGSSFRQALYFMECGFNLHDTMIYHKINPLPNNYRGNRYNLSFEYMFVISKGKPNTFHPLEDKKVVFLPSKKINMGRNKDGSRKKGFAGNSPYKIRENVWNYKIGGNHTATDKIAYEHPAIFPEKLAYDHIVSWSDEGDIVFDPFMGSGTTAKMCEKSNRNWIGCEVSEEYCKIITRRLINELIQSQLDYKRT